MKKNVRKAIAILILSSIIPIFVGALNYNDDPKKNMFIADIFGNNFWQGYIAGYLVIIGILILIWIIISCIRMLDS